MGKTTLRGGEDSINAELRALTDKTRQLRQELRELMNHPGSKDLTKGHAHVPASVRGRSASDSARDQAKQPRAGDTSKARTGRRLKRSR